MDTSYYVYVYCNPIKNGIYTYIENCICIDFLYEPFYIGRGKDSRLYNHLSEAHNTNINSHKLNTIRKIWKIGQQPIIYKIADNLSNDSANVLERFLINVIGRKNKNLGPLTNLTDGGDGQAGRIVSIETRQKISEKLTGRILPEDHPARRKGRKPSKESNIKRKISLINYYKNNNRPEFTEEVKKQISNTLKNKYQNDIEFKNRMYYLHHNECTQEKRNESNKKAWLDENKYKTNKQNRKPKQPKRSKEEVRSAISESVKKLWQNPEYIKKHCGKNHPQYVEPYTEIEISIIKQIRNNPIYMYGTRKVGAEKIQQVLSTMGIRINKRHIEKIIHEEKQQEINNKDPIKI